MAFVNVKPAATSHSSHQFNPVTVASLDYAQLVATRCIEVAPGDHFKNVKCNSFLRLSPQIFPAYGRTSFHTATFFVPEDQLLESSKAFHSDMKTYKGKAVVMPWINSWEINHLFSSPDYATNLATLVGHSTDPATDTTNIPKDSQGNIDPWLWDYIDPYVDTNQTLQYGYFKLTHLGKVYYKILKSLGFDWKSYSCKPTSGYSTIYDLRAEQNFTPNVLPLLAYAKIYTDMFLNGHTYNNDMVVRLLRDVHNNEDYVHGFSTIYDSSTGHFFGAAVEDILMEVSVPHLRNFYLEAWNSPNSPTGVAPDTEMYNTNMDSLISPFVPDKSDANTLNTFTNTVTTTYASTPNPNTNDLAFVTSLGIKILDVVYKFVKRNNLFGNSSFDRFFARFGIKPQSETVIKLVEGKTDIDFSAVMSNSDTYNSGSGKTLGAFAGFGVGSLNWKFNYKSDKFGYIISLNWLQVVPMLVHGFFPAVLRKYPKDWYTPEFDGQTIRPIPMCEISQCKTTDLLTSDGDTKVYGFMNLYDDYRFQRDMVLGDFVTDRNTSNFVFARDMSWFRDNGSVKMAPLNKSIQYYDHRNNPDMTNPFQESATVADRFYLQCTFDMSASRLAKSRSSVLDLNGEGDLSLALGGNEMV